MCSRASCGSEWNREHGPEYVDPTDQPVLTSRLQVDVLFVVSQNGPVAASDVAYHLPLSSSSIRYALGRLERLALVAAQYTGVSNLRARHYVTTDAGDAELGRHDEEEGS